MKIYNHELISLSELLFRLKLKGKSSRMRTRLLKQIEEYQNDIYLPQLEELVSQYAKYDENGEMVKSENENEVLLKEESIHDYHRELDVLLNEFFVVEENEANEEIIKTVSRVLLECEEEFSCHEATVFDIFCDRFEEAVCRYDDKEEK